MNALWLFFLPAHSTVEPGSVPSTAFPCPGVQLLLLQVTRWARKKGINLAPLPLFSYEDLGAQFLCPQLSIPLQFKSLFWADTDTFSHISVRKVSVLLSLFATVLRMLGRWSEGSLSWRPGVITSGKFLGVILHTLKHWPDPGPLFRTHFNTKISLSRTRQPSALVCGGEACSLFGQVHHRRKE